MTLHDPCPSAAARCGSLVTFSRALNGTTLELNVVCVSIISVSFVLILGLSLFEDVCHIKLVSGLVSTVLHRRKDKPPARIWSCCKVPPWSVGCWMGLASQCVGSNRLIPGVTWVNEINNDAAGPYHRLSHCIEQPVWHSHLIPTECIVWQ